MGCVRGSQRLSYAAFTPKAAGRSRRSTASPRGEKALPGACRLERVYTLTLYVSAPLRLRCERGFTSTMSVLQNSELRQVCTPPPPPAAAASWSVLALFGSRKSGLS